MRCWLREKSFVDALKLFFNPLDLLPRRVALLAIQLRCCCAGQPPMGALHNRRHYLQIADQFSGWPGRGLLLPQRFEKQRRIVQYAFPDGGRSSPPGGIQLAGFARAAVMLGEDGRHPLTVLQALPRHRQ
jgi:hypothetical protein